MDNEKLPAAHDTVEDGLDTSSMASDEKDLAATIVPEHAQDIHPADERRVVRKIDLFLIPWMWIGYGFVYYDKVIASLPVSIIYTFHCSSFRIITSLWHLPLPSHPPSMPDFPFHFETTRIPPPTLGSLPFTQLLSSLPLFPLPFPFTLSHPARDYPLEILPPSTPPAFPPTHPG